MSSTMLRGSVPIEAISIPSSVNIAKQVMESSSSPSISFKKKLSKARNAETPPFEADEYLDDKKARKRHKSPLQRLLRTLSRSPLRRHRKSSSNDLQMEDEKNDQAIQHRTERRANDGVSSLGTADYASDPLGSASRSSVHSQPRLGIQPSRSDAYESGNVSTSCSSASRSDYEEDTTSSSHNSPRDARDTDSLAAGSRDSRGSSKHQRPLPTKLSSRRKKIQDRPPTPSRSLPAVEENNALNEKPKTLKNESSREARQEKSRKTRSTEVLWNKQATAQGASTKDSSISSDASLFTRVLLLLLHPESKFFELIQLVFSPEHSTIGDLLDSIPVQATQAKLANQNYAGLVRAVKDAEAWTHRLQPATDVYAKNYTITPAGIILGDILVAIPYGYTRRHIVRLGCQILAIPQIKSLVVDKFRAETKIPTRITTLYPEEGLQQELKDVSESSDPRSSMKKALEKENAHSSSRGIRDRWGKVRHGTPPPAAFWRKSSGINGCSDMKSDEKRQHVQESVDPVSRRILMSANVPEKEDTSASEDRTMEDNILLVDGFNAHIEPEASTSSSLQSETIREEPRPVAVSRSLMASSSDDVEDTSTSEDRSNCEDKIILMAAREVSSNCGPDVAEPRISDNRAEPHLPSPRSPEENHSSPIRQRIDQIEKRIATCPQVPVPLEGPFEFAQTEHTGKDIPGLVPSAQSQRSLASQESQDSEPLSEQSDEGLMHEADAKEPSEKTESNDARLIESCANSEEHRDILREALAHIGHLPVTQTSSLDSVVNEYHQCGHHEDDEATAATENTTPSRAPLAAGGQYDEQSAGMSYSAWSHSIDSSLVSRYSLMSNASKTTTEDMKLAEARSKSRQRRREKAKMKRSARKLALSVFLFMVGLYNADPSRRANEAAAAGGEIVAAGFNTPLGVYGILQFAFALAALIKLQILWKGSTELKAKQCPFTQAFNVFLDGLKDGLKEDGK